MSIFQQNTSLKPYNTFGIAVNARYFAAVSTPADLQELLNSDLLQTQPLLILGGGSNVLFTKDFEGLALKVSIPGISAVADGDEVLVTAGAGAG